MERNTNVKAYEANLKMRLKELREGDPAYKLHELVFMEAFVFASELHQDKLPQRILDVGCGLGFMTKSLSKLGQEAVGIDVSEAAISLAKKEHKGINFYPESAESFSEKMPGLGITIFDQAILNMVLHSVDDQSVQKILNSVRKCIKPEGTVLILVPTEEWLVYKLIDYAQDKGMKKEPGIAWVEKMLRSNEVKLPVKIGKGEYYPEPLTIYHRSLERYGELLQASDFGVRWNTHDGITGERTHSQIIPYLDMFDYLANGALQDRKRILLMSFAL